MHFPKVSQYISHNLSPTAVIAKYIKENMKDSKIVFIGPCTSKKMEFQQEEINQYIDSVMTFEELQALFDSCDIDITTLGEDVLVVPDVLHMGKKIRLKLINMV